MNHVLRLALTCLILASAAVGAPAFEGKINFKVTTGGGKSQDMSYLVKGDKLRMEMPLPRGMTGVVLLEPAKRQAVMLMDAQKMAMVMALPDPASPAPGEAKGETPKLEKTGEKEKILGHTAEKYLVTYRGAKSDLWLAEGLGSFVSFNPGAAMPGGRGGAPAQEEWMRALAGKELFPLRVVTYDKSAQEASRLEATAIEKQSLPDSLFVVPADYQRMDMGAMMKGMMPGGLSAPPR